MKKKEGYIRPGEAAKFLGINIDTLNAWADDSVIPYYRPTAKGHRRYKISELEAFMQSRRVRPIKQPVPEAVLANEVAIQFGIV